MNRKLYILFIPFSFFYTLSEAQDKILVAEGTIKVGGFSEENMYFGFAQGDKIVFSVTTEGKKELKEVEIIEYPATTRFTSFKSNSIHEKIISVTKEGVYQFRLKNGGLGKRVCKYSIQRIPLSEEYNPFNTTVEWVTKTDTTWRTYTKDAVVGYDTTYLKQTKKVVDQKSQEEVLLLDKTERVHSQTNSNSNKTWIYFTLPEKSTTELETKEIVAWAYWVGVGDEANKAWENNRKTISGLTKTVAAAYITPLGAFAVGALTELILPSNGEDVYYAVTDQDNKNQFIAGNEYYIKDRGKGVAGYKKFVDPHLCNGTYYICLSNDNVMLGIDVAVKVVAITESTTYIYQEVSIPIVIPKFEKQIFSEPEIHQQQIPVIIK